MKKSLAVSCIMLCLCIRVFSQETPPKLSKHEKDSLHNEIETMLANDQKYRWMIMYGELDGQKLEAFKKMDEAAKWQRMTDVQKDKIGISKTQKDSLWQLQSQIDSVNFLKLSGIITKYGFPHKYVEEYKATSILLHADPQLMTDNFFRMLIAEVKFGNLSPIGYAGVYDRVQLDRKLPELYYVSNYYDSTTGTSKPKPPLDLDKTNKAREEIGLGKYKAAE